MAKYRKKPVVIEAFQWTGGPDQTEDPIWAIEAIRDGRIVFEGKSETFCLVVRTLEDGRDWKAKHVASPGDWIIRGIKGELYPCKPDIFKATYEAVEEAQ